MTEKDIQKALWIKYRSHEFRFLNTYFFGNESDYLTFLRGGYCYDIEIKISVSDFRADFKKPRHELFRGLAKGLKKIVYYRYEANLWCCIFHITKDGTIRRKEINDTCRFTYVETDWVANRFMYAVPEGLLDTEDMPEYAGLLWITKEGEVIEKRKAPLLHKKKHNPKKVFMKMYRSYESMARKHLFK